jgi:hypothetical protein
MEIQTGKVPRWKSWEEDGKYFIVLGTSWKDYKEI